MAGGTRRHRAFRPAAYSRGPKQSTDHRHGLQPVCSPLHRCRDTRSPKEFEERAYTAFRNAFNKQYNGERIPLQLGFHFVKMNGGAYWNAFERLLREVCKKDDVACVSYAQAMPMIEARQKHKTEG